MFDNVREDLKVFKKHHGNSNFAFVYYPMATAVLMYRLSAFLYNYRVLRVFSYLLVRLNDFLHGIWIGPRVKAGPGLFLAHARGLVVNPETTMGKNVTLLQRVTLGGPGIVIGDGVTISANATVISRKHKNGYLEIGANSIVGAGAVVINDVPENVVVAGNPAKILSKKNES